MGQLIPWISAGFPLDFRWIQYCKVVRFVILVRIRTNLVRLVRYVRIRTKLTTGIAYMDITNLNPAVPKREWSVWCL